MLKPFLPTSTKWLGPDFSITVIVFTGPSLPELDATANAPPPTTNATTPATPAVVRSLRSMVFPPVGWTERAEAPACRGKPSSAIRHSVDPWRRHVCLAYAGAPRRGVPDRPTDSQTPVRAFCVAEGDEHECNAADRRSRDLAGANRRGPRPREAAHPGGRRDRRRPATTADGRGRPDHAAGRFGRRCAPDRHVRGAYATLRVVHDVVRRCPGRRSVRRLYQGQRSGARTVVPALARRDVRRLLPGTVPGERPLPGVPGLGDAVLLGARDLARRAHRRSALRNERVLSAHRRRGVRDVLDHGPGKRDEGELVRDARPNGLWSPGVLGGLPGGLAAAVPRHAQRADAHG